MPEGYAPHAEQGLLLLVNGKPTRIRALAITDGPGKLPVWLADVDGHQGAAGTLDSALLLAARAAAPKEV